MFDAETRSAIATEAKRIGVAPAVLLAVAEVESAGVPFWTVDGDQVPAIRFEGHYFDRLLSGRKRERARAEGLAHPRAGVVKNPRSYEGRYNLLKRAMAIDPVAALMSCSWGLGQVMGKNWEDLDYSSVEDLVEEAKSGVAGQVRLMVRFIEKNGLVSALEARNWALFARRYNGPGYRKNRYDTKMAAAYRRYSRDPLDLGVRELQKALKTLGYYTGRIDGIRGKKTVAAIREFQEQFGLVVDGRAGPMTWEEINEALENCADKSAEKQAKGGAGTAAGGLGAAVVVEQATDALQNASDKLEPLTQNSEWIMYAFVVLALAGAGVALLGIFRRRA